MDDESGGLVEYRIVDVPDEAETVGVSEDEVSGPVRGLRKSRQRTYYLFPRVIRVILV